MGVFVCFPPLFPLQIVVLVVCPFICVCVCFFFSTADVFAECDIDGPILHELDDDNLISELAIVNEVKIFFRLLRRSASSPHSMFNPRFFSTLVCIVSH